jgi:hypothetical protein
MVLLENKFHIGYVTSFPLQRPGFNPMSGHVGCVVDKVALGKVFSCTSVPSPSHVLRSLIILLSLLYSLKTDTVIKNK